MFRTSTILIFFIFLFSSILSAQSVKGVVKDGETGAPLAGASVHVLHTPFGASTATDGSFSITGLTPGEYLVSAQLIGYQAVSFYLEVSESEKEPLNIEMETAVLNLNSRIVTSASRFRDDAFNLPEAIGLMDRRELNERIPRSLPEAMIGMTGVWMQKTNHGGGSPFIRGLTGNQALMLIDGIRLNNATFRYGPNQYLNTIDPFAIDQIEVIRGSGSVLYGSDALGGVVNIMTPEPVLREGRGGLTGETGVKYMSEEMEKSGYAALQYGTEQFGIAANASVSSFGHLVAGGTAGKESPSAYDQYAWSVKSKNRIGERSFLTTGLQYLRQDDVPRFDQVVSGRYLNYSFEPQIRFLGYSRLGVFRSNPLFRQVVLTASYQRSIEGRTKVRPDNPVVTREKDDVHTIGINAEVHSRLAANWQMISGIEYYGDYVESWRKDRDTENGVVADKRGLYADGAQMASFALYSSHTWSLNRAGIRAGIRYNLIRIEAADDLFGSMELTPQALVGNFSLLYDLTDSYRWLATVNSGFRAPNINDISSFGSFDYGIEVPNGDLSPEKTLTFETGLKRRGKLFSGAFYLYMTNLYDLMARVPATYNGSELYQGDRVYRKENKAESYIQGVEAEAEARLHTGLNLYGGIAYTYGQNITDDEPVRRIPPLNGRLGISYRALKNSWLSLEWLFAEVQTRLSAGDIDDNRIPVGGTPGWHVINLHGTTRLQSFNIRWGVQNLFDELYRIHGSGTDGYGRSLYLGVSLGF